MKLRRYLASSLLVLGLLSVPLMHVAAQPPVTLNPFPAPQIPSQILTYDGSNNLIYLCITKPNGPWNGVSVPATYSWTRAATTLTDIADSSNTATATTSTAHGLRPGNQVVVAGVTTDTDLNGTYVIATVPTSATLTFTTANVTDGTYTDAGMTLTTNAPRSNVAIWAIQRFLYDGSNNLTSTVWANGSSAYTFACDSASTYNYR